MWDAIACCFFLDTAPNVLRYLDVIWKCLKPGGLLVSLGPLLYHWTDKPAESLFNLSDAAASRQGGASKAGGRGEEASRAHEDYGHGYDLSDELDRAAADQLIRTA